MKKILILLSFLCVLVPTYASSPGDMLYGKWKVVAILDSARMVSSSEAFAKQGIGQYLIITPKEIRFRKEIGLSPIFNKSKQDTFDYFYSVNGFRMDPTNLRLPEIVTEIMIDYENVISVYAIYIKNKNSIVFFWRGYFYKAIRSK
ncbi:hypothetical protein [Paraherbaspirillum soli]|uniref:DUF2147 domain-containing protein n=1 Tax=Paraherbaspirillum soli TaxID=631222 RepID=A0ABW0M967_9BURK